MHANPELLQQHEPYTHAGKYFSDGVGLACSGSGISLLVVET